MNKAKLGCQVENTYIDERVASLLPQFEALAPFKISQRKKGTGDLLGWERLAAIEAKNLKIAYPDDRPEDEKTYGTCLRQITALKKALRASAKTQLNDKALYNPVLTIITHFGEALSYQFASYKERQNFVYKQQVKERSQPESRIEIDLTSYLNRANNLLTRIASGDEEGIDWKDVSCAIALATGRRMAEVHLSAKFELVGEYEIAFNGQLKGKSRRIEGKSLKDVIFRIPTLLPAKLVCFALNWLNSKNKRLPPDEDTDRVNRRWSKVLNQAAKDWEIIPEMTYHKFRAAYFRASIINAAIDPFDYISYAKKILGDEDENTIQTYQRFSIKAGTVTKA
ncbi:protelomerase family protein [Anabaena azotica]|uniref:Telomere resolvase ResT/TelK catalytic domain-containing protein n=1 Tax=Anabaena azotica FACHB-119 TaxID=947527 RepID=A0ABR8DAJ7_9NOST|nr:protelomerase family protein [Anabaena azotica]MBD2503937.1 hypothetical protein [Anabaena azotica FACHB-119]